MSATYIALIHAPVGGSDWGVTFPDLPGCTSSGDSWEDAVASASEALTGHVAALLAEGDSVPLLRTYADLIQDAEVKADCVGGAASPVSVMLIDVAVVRDAILCSGFPGVRALWHRTRAGFVAGTVSYPFRPAHEPESLSLNHSAKGVRLGLLPRAAHDPAALFSPVERQALGQISGIDRWPPDPSSA